MKYMLLFLIGLTALAYADDYSSKTVITDKSRWMVVKENDIIRWIELEDYTKWGECRITGPTAKELADKLCKLSESNCKEWE